VIEAIVLLLLIFAGGWLVLATLGFLLKMMVWLFVGLFSLLGGVVFLVVMLPLALLLGVVLLPLLILGLLPVVMPMLLLAAVVWWLVRDSRPRQARLGT
jgi:hypothetical protein